MSSLGLLNYSSANWRQTRPGKTTVVYLLISDNSSQFCFPNMENALQIYTVSPKK